MRKLLCLAVGLASLSTICSAQTITETFGIGANAFTMDFVTIGNPGNAADTTGSPNPAGSVAYTYNLGKYEVSRDQITKASTEGGLGITMVYTTIAGYTEVDRPATGVTVYEAANFVNWLNTSTGGTAAYKLVGGTFQLWSPTDAGYNANNMFRNTQAKYVIASNDEWYKGAYGNKDGTWNNFPTGSDIAPTAVASGTAANTAVYQQGSDAGPAYITSAGGLSPWGTVGQGGNVWEMTETAYDGTNDTAGENRAARGGSWYDLFFAPLASDSLDASFQGSPSPTYEFYRNGGFRVAMIPEPSSLSLLALGGVVVALRKCKRV